MVLLLAVSACALANTNYTIVPAGAAGPGIYLDKVVPDLEGSESLPVVDRLPRIARQPLWAIYDVGEAITGGLRMYGDNGRLVRSSSIIVELYQLLFYRQKAYYTLVFRETRVRCGGDGVYRFSVPTDGREVGFYQVRLGLPNGNELDPEFRIQIGDAVFTNDVPPPDFEEGCGCG